MHYSQQNRKLLDNVQFTQLLEIKNSENIMRKLMVLVTLLLLCSRLLVEQSLAVTAYPYPVQITQRDGTKLTVILQGDEKVKWAKTLDDYALVFNGQGVYEYAKLDASGDMVPSGVKARDIMERTPAELSLLTKTQKNLIYSPSQVSIMKQVWSNLKSGGPELAFPTTGSRKLICILMGFTDKAFTKTKLEFQNLFNQVGYVVDGATGSVKDFFTEASYNQFNLTVDVAGPFTASKTHAYYGTNVGGTEGNDEYPQQLVTEAVTLADPTVNFADYDNDGNGWVDGVYVIFAGYGEEAGGDPNCIWSHAWGIPTVVLDGKSISSYSCSPELRNASGSGLTRIGVICHEFGHVLGAPDFYDTNYTTGGSYAGTGYWDLQASGSWNGSLGDGATPAQPNPYTKAYVYGWISVTTLTAQTTVTLANAAQNSTSFYRINTATSGEYYLLENRQKVGFDSWIPGHGLLIYHVSKDLTGMNTTFPQKMYPVCATAGVEPGSTPASYGAINGDGCPFPGTGLKTAFTDATLPSQKSWAGELTNKPVTSITENNTAKTITFCFRGCVTSSDPGIFTSSSSSESQIDLLWTKNTSSNPVMVAFSTTPLFGTPVNGTVYVAGNAIPGGGTVIYKGSLTAYSHTGLTASTTYYYKAWSVLTGNGYSLGRVTETATACPGISTFPYTQTFDDAVFTPTCWTSFVGTNGLGLSSNWIRKTSNTNNASAGAAFVGYEAVSGGLAQDWLVTPRISIPATGITSLKFYQRQGYTTVYTSSYSVRVSTTSQTDIAGYTAISTYGESTFSITYSLLTLDLTAYAGQQVYIVGRRVHHLILLFFI